MSQGIIRPSPTGSWTAHAATAPLVIAVRRRLALVALFTLGLVIRGAPAGAAASDFHARWVDQSPWPLLAPGATVAYTLHFKNTGTAPWVRGTASQANLGINSDSTTFSSLGMNVGWLSANRV